MVCTLYRVVWNQGIVAILQLCYGFDLSKLSIKLSLDFFSKKSFVIFKYQIVSFPLFAGWRSCAKPFQELLCKLFSFRVSNHPISKRKAMWEYYGQVQLKKLHKKNRFDWTQMSWFGCPQEFFESWFWKVLRILKNEVPPGFGGQVTRKTVWSPACRWFSCIWGVSKNLYLL
jgi:hypothetical protein